MNRHAGHCVRALGLAAALLLGGCSAYNADLSQAQCEAFVDRYLGLGGNVGNDALGPEQRQELRRTGVRDCRNRTLGVNQAEFDCAMRAGTRDEYRACGITLRG